MGIPACGWQYEILACSFCKKGQISCIWFPSAISIKRNITASLPGKGSVSKSRNIWIVKSGCSECGKSQDEVEKQFQKEGFA
ncbi:MAG: hypothetical protein ACREBI_02470 [Nitrosotalea sp.]